MTPLISFYITFCLNLEQEQGTLGGLKPKCLCQYWEKHQTIAHVSSAVLNATQISLVYTLQKSLMMMIIGILNTAVIRMTDFQDK